MPIDTTYALDTEIAFEYNCMDKYITDDGYLRLLINNTEDPIWLVDTEFHIIECNRSFKTWVSCFIGHELGKGDHVLFNGRDKKYQEKFEMCYQLALIGKSFRTVEDMEVNGKIRYTNVSFNPVYDSEQSIIGVSCYARDITEQRMHLLKIEEQNTALREIAYIESHKVRVPVANILGLEQLFNHEDPTDPFNKEILANISVLAKQLDLIIREVVQKSNDIGLP